MAEFDTQMTGGSVPGRTGEVLANIDTRTGNQELAAASAELAGAGIDMSLTIWKLQADTELTDAVAADQEVLNDFFSKMKGNPDTHTYDTEFAKVMDGINGREIKNGLAARGHRKYIATMTPKWDADVTAAKEAKTTDLAYASMFENEQQAIDTGNLFPALRSYKSNVSAGIMSAEEAAKRMNDTVHKAERRAAQSIALNDPDALLSAIKGDRIEGFNNLTPGDVVDMRQTALSQKAFNSKQQDVALGAITNDVLAKASEGKTPKEMAELLRQTVGLTEIERTQLMEVFNSAYRTWNQTNADPWTTTQDYPTMLAVKNAIDNGKIRTESQLYRAVLDTKKGPLVSYDDMQTLTRLLPDRKSAALKSPFAIERLNKVDALFEDEEGNIVDDEAWGLTYRAVEAAIQENWPDIVKTNKAVEAILAPVKEAKAKSWLDSFAKVFFPLERHLARKVIGKQ